jgi:hypothetical protein
MVALRQMQGVFSQLDKATLVAKLKSGRERKKRETGKGCGRKSLAELVSHCLKEIVTERVRCLT